MRVKIQMDKKLLLTFSQGSVYHFCSYFPKQNIKKTIDNKKQV